MLSDWEETRAEAGPAIVIAPNGTTLDPERNEWDEMLIELLCDADRHAENIPYGLSRDMTTIARIDPTMSTQTESESTGRPGLTPRYPAGTPEYDNG